MRRETTVTLNDRGKDLTFRIREMSASQLESWIMRAILLLSDSGLELGADMQKAGEFLQGSGLKALAGVRFEKAKPLLDELLACCTRVDAGVEQHCSPETVDGYIEDVQTLFKLRVEAIKLNLGFFAQGHESPLNSAVNMPIGKPRV